jgi:uncharacterized membrane protein
VDDPVDERVRRRRVGILDQQRERSGARRHTRPAEGRSRSVAVGSVRARDLPAVREIVADERQAGRRLETEAPVRESILPGPLGRNAARDEMWQPTNDAAKRVLKFHAREVARAPLYVRLNDSTGRHAAPERRKASLCYARRMKLDGRLAAWREADLISAEQAHAIRAFEEDRRGSATSWVVVALGALGALAVVSGLISLVAANWSNIPAGVKLGAGLALLAGSLAGAAAADRAARSALADLLLFAHGGLVLAMIGLVAQTYHLSGAPWRALALAAALTIPAAVVSQRSLLSDLPAAFALLFVWLLVEHDRRVQQFTGYGLGQALLFAAAASVLLFVGEAVQSLHPAATRALRRWGAAVLAGVSLAAALSWTVHWSGQTPSGSLAVCAACGGVWVAWFVRKKNAPLVVAALALSALVLGAAFVTGRSVSVTLLPAVRAGTTTARLLGFALFCTAGGAFAVAAARSGSRWRTNLFAAVVAVRVFALFVEVVRSLAFTGVGLLVTGAAFCAVAFGFWMLRDALPVREVAGDG